MCYYCMPILVLTLGIFNMFYGQALINLHDVGKHTDTICIFGDHLGSIESVVHPKF